jgi:hypothetical protein
MKSRSLLMSLSVFGEAVVKLAGCMHLIENSKSLRRRNEKDVKLVLCTYIDIKNVYEYKRVRAFVKRESDYESAKS